MYFAILIAALVVLSPGSGLLNIDHCQATYGQVTYREENSTKKPPLLYSFPGSGNTWVRILIERATGIYSGSVYQDKTLLQILPGEEVCDFRVSVVKAHPLYLLKEPSRNKGKCSRGGIKTFDKAVFLLRDPFDAIWSEYQRRVSKSHVMGLTSDDFDSNHWIMLACQLSFRYLSMWEKDMTLMKQAMTENNILIIHYEDLLNHTTRLYELKRIFSFVETSSIISDDALLCAFMLSENSGSKRLTKKDMVLKQNVYNKNIVCKMWAIFGSYAMYAGYFPWGGHVCGDNMASGIKDRVTTDNKAWTQRNCSSWKM